jgi:hypothetical protein
MINAKNAVVWTNRSTHEVRVREQGDRPGVIRLARSSSDNPTYLSGRARICKKLRLAAVPEG